MRILNLVTLVLIIIGGLNWGLVGIAGIDLVAEIFGAGSTPGRVVYILIGLSAVWQLILLIKRKA